MAEQELELTMSTEAHLPAEHHLQIVDDDYIDNTAVVHLGKLLTNDLWDEMRVWHEVPEQLVELTYNNHHICMDIVFTGYLI